MFALHRGRPRARGRPDERRRRLLPALAGDRAAARRRRDPAARRHATPTSGATCSAPLLPVGSFVISLVMFFALLGRDEDDRQVAQHLYTWIEVGGFDVGMDLLYDPLSALFLLLITGVGSLIHVYSIGYMAHDPRRRRFFGYLNLFVAAMLMLVLVGELPRPVPRLGGRRPGVVPADRLLAAQALRGRRGQEGVRHQPGRRHGDVAGDHADRSSPSARPASP